MFKGGDGDSMRAEAPSAVWSTANNASPRCARFEDGVLFVCVVVCVRACVAHRMLYGGFASP